MSETHDELTRLIDRLVDDELDRDERRQLILRLEDDTDSWRLCALAFIEAQSLRRAIGNLRTERVDKSLQSADVTTKHAASKPAARLLTIAATLAIAVGFGMAIGWRTAPGQTPPQNGTIVVPDSIPGDQAVAIEDQRPSTTEAPTSSGDENTARPAVRAVAYASIGDGTKRGPRVPVIAGAGREQAWLRERPSISERERMTLERRGWRVAQDCRFLFLELADGQEITIPFETYHCQFVGNAVY